MTGERRKGKGERRKEKGERRMEKGERRKEKGERRKKKGERGKKESGKSFGFDYIYIYADHRINLYISICIYIYTCKQLLDKTEFHSNQAKETHRLFHDVTCMS